MTAKGSKLQGKVAVITGGNSGIGIARAFKSEGAKEVIIDRSQEMMNTGPEPGDDFLTLYKGTGYTNR